MNKIKKSLPQLWKAINGGGAYEERIQLQRFDAVRITINRTTDIHLFD